MNLNRWGQLGRGHLAGIVYEQQAVWASEAIHGDLSDDYNHESWREVSTYLLENNYRNQVSPPYRNGISLELNTYQSYQDISRFMHMWYQSMDNKKNGAPQHGAHHTGYTQDPWNCGLSKIFSNGSFQRIETKNLGETGKLWETDESAIVRYSKICKLEWVTILYHIITIIPLLVRSITIILPYYYHMITIILWVSMSYRFESDPIPSVPAHDDVPSRGSFCRDDHTCSPDKTLWN